MIDYTAAVELTYQSRWAGSKDGERSRTRALYAGLELLTAHPPFGYTQAWAVREGLTQKGMAPGTVNRHLAAYFSVWRTCVQRGLLQHGPPSGVLLKEPRGRTRVVTDDELLALTGHMGLPGGLLATFLARTGCRVSEALGLTAADVDWNGDAVTFRDTKNGDDRTIPLPRDGRGYVGMYVVGVSARPSQGEFNREWDRARRKMGLENDPGFVPHALRHTYASRLVNAGVPLPVVARLLGHRSIRTTMRYTHVSLNDSLTALKRAGIL